MVQLDRELLAELDAGLLTPDLAARVQAAADTELEMGPHRLADRMTRAG